MLTKTNTSHEDISEKHNSIKHRKSSQPTLRKHVQIFVNQFSIKDHIRSEAWGVEEDAHGNTTDETSDGNGHDPTVSK